MIAGWSRLTRLIAIVCLVGLLATADLILSRPGLSSAVSPRAPRLLVLVVFDQLRGDYLERWEPLFGKDGFHRLLDDGAWFTNCHYPYAHTVTGAGHASLLTGCSPDKHGIVGNDWWERRLGRRVGCVDSERYEQVPPATRGFENGNNRVVQAGTSPERLLAPTLGEALKKATGGRARVVSISFKDRSAILPAGRRTDACYWLDSESGQFVTSTYYRGRLHPWVAALNDAKPANRWFGRDWQRLRPEIDYARSSGPDDMEGEGTGVRQGRTFPHLMTGGDKEPGSAYYHALFNSPFGNELLLELAKRAIDAEHLGNGPFPDLLCISFSSNDAVGHTWGPDSQEVLDVTLRSDLIVRDLLSHLDARVGAGRYVVALTADHGICPLPEVSRGRRIPPGKSYLALGPDSPPPELDRGIQAARIPVEGVDGLVNRANRFLNATFAGEGREAHWFEIALLPWLWLNHGELRARGLDSAEVEKKLAEWLTTQPGIQTVYTRSQLLAPLSAGDELGQSVRRSFHTDRCGELFVVNKPYYLFMGSGSSTFATGTNHGTPHAYDTHVPLLVYGPGIPGGPRSERVTPQAIAAIFAYFLGIPPPEAAEATVPETLFP
jgi:hypothetical protein